MSRQTLPLRVRLDGRTVRSETTIARVDADAWALATTLPNDRLELHSSYLASRHHDEVAVSHLTYSPARNSTSARTVAYEDLPVSESARACLYDHLQAVQDAAHELGAGPLQIDNLDPAIAAVTPS